MLAFECAPGWLSGPIQVLRLRSVDVFLSDLCLDTAMLHFAQPIGQKDG
jgi:hypothetical protein